MRAAPLLAVALSLGFALTVLGVPRISSAQAPAATNDPVSLRGNQNIHEDRVQLLRNEFRERQLEIREQREYARTARNGKTAHGRRVQQVPGDDDRAAGAALARAANPFGIGRTFIAPTNTKVNDKTGDAIGAGQAEQSLAFVGQNGLCAWNNGQGFNRTPQDVQGWGYTTNGGASWTDGGIPLKQGIIATWSSDPVVTVNEKTGTFFYCGLTINNTGLFDNGVGVVRGHFAGATYVQDWLAMVTSGGKVFDKAWIAADSSNGNVYVTWTQISVVGNIGTIMFSRSTDNGNDWSAPLQINEVRENSLVSGSRPVVGPNGEVYVVYSAIGPVDADSMKIAKSTNGGASFSPPVVAGIVYENYFTGAPGFNRPNAVTFPSVAVDRSFGPNRGRVYMSHQDCVDFYLDGLGGGTSQNEIEDNGNFANATPFAIGQTLRGAISLTSDQDWWKFSATQGTTYIFFADSVKKSNFSYTMRLYCPNDTLALSRLAFSGNKSLTDGTVHALIVWTAPITSTYYLRMLSIGSTGRYRIQTGVHTPNGSDVARDARDIMVVSSPDGITWGPRVRVNDDAPLYDNWLPEVAVPCDGNVYAMWFDWRDTPASCFGGSNIYVSRSTNGGGTWSANQVATTAVTPNWTQVASNIAPNQGDYNGMYGGDAVGLAFADGRLGDADVFAAKLDITPTITCSRDSTVLVATTYNTTLYITNPNQMFSNEEFVNVTLDRSWPGVPVSGSAGVLAPLGSTGVPFSLAIPDTAANSDVHLCFKVTCAGGTCVQTCCVTLHVVNLATATLASLVDASADNGVVKVSWLVAGSAQAHLYRSVDGTAWTYVTTLTPDGSQHVSYEDGSVVRGQRYWYRLGIVQPTGEMPAGEVAVDVPLNVAFALNGARPNPSLGRPTLSFSLMDNSPARIELVDLGGRRVFEREVGSMGAGFHVLPIGQDRSLPIGIYAVRLTQHGRVLSSKVTIIR